MLYVNRATGPFRKQSASIAAVKGGLVEDLNAVFNMTTLTAMINQSSPHYNVK